jgi:hypothetical protein
MQQGNTTFNTDEIDIHIRGYRSVLKSSGFLEIKSLIHTHTQMQPLLHEKAHAKEIDTAAFIYSLLRLPDIMSTVRKVILGQSYSVFKKHGYREITKWKEVTTPGRRRKMYYNGKDTLAVYIASVTDLDDIISLLTAYQIEWNKMHDHLKNAADVRKKAAAILPASDREKIENIWGTEYHKFLTAIKYREIEVSVYLLSGGYIEYAKSTKHWWEHIQKTLLHLRLFARPIYFISSNTHSLANLITRFAPLHEKEILAYLDESGDQTLIELFENLKTGSYQATMEYFLHYVSKKALKNNKALQKLKTDLEKKSGIHTIPATQFLDIDTQIIEVKNISSSLAKSNLARSNAIIINIDYPLGWAAYQVLTEIGQNVDTVRGIYIMGKAATLTGQIGDIMIPNVIFDQHTKNTYAIQNCFSAKDLIPLYKTGMILDNQKTVSVKGTFFESDALLKSWYKEGYTDIEMESGPFLNAAYEFVYYNRYEENQFINFTSLPFELGILHYASDTPYSKAKNLGVRNLSYEGVESTYACTKAILEKIIRNELKLLKG